MKSLLSKVVLLPLALAGCVVVAPGGPGPGPGRPGAVVIAPTPAIVFAPAVSPYVYEVVTISPYVYTVRYLPPYVSRVQVLAAFRNECAVSGRHPVAGPIRVTNGHDRHGRPAAFRVMTVYCR